MVVARVEQRVAVRVEKMADLMVEKMAFERAVELVDKLADS